MTSTRVLELYCGIGGMHWALQMTTLPFEIIAAMEINPSVLTTYAHNFPNDNVVNRNIQSLTVEELNDMEIDLIIMSPPCQPFCRTGLKKDIKDPRTDSFQHILKILPDVQFQYLLLENVKGFEDSEVHTILLETLKKCNFQWQEFLLTPMTVGIPNSRLRYYIIGKRQNINWCFNLTPSILSEVPLWNLDPAKIPYSNILNTEIDIWTTRRKNRLALSEIDIKAEDIPKAWCVGDIIENLEPNETSAYSLSPHIVEKYEKAMDIVDKRSVQTCCFTKSYGQYLKGTGSIFNQCPGQCGVSELEQTSKPYHNLRFFTPKEISRLLCYPDSFNFPSNLSWKQKSKSLGNSINVYIVAILLALLLKN